MQFAAGAVIGALGSWKVKDWWLENLKLRAKWDAEMKQLEEDAQKQLMQDPEYPRWLNSTMYEQMQSELDQHKQTVKCSTCDSEAYNRTAHCWNASAPELFDQCSKTVSKWSIKWHRIPEEVREKMKDKRFHLFLEAQLKQQTEFDQHLEGVKDATEKRKIYEANMKKTQEIVKNL